MSADAQRRYKERYPERVAESQRRHTKTPKFKEKMAAWRQANPDKRKAQNVVTHALRDGKLERPDVCEHCGVTPEPRSNGASGIEASHTDYSRPLDIEWLCKPCHYRKDNR